GPYPPDELKAKGLLAPDTWVCPAGTQQVGQVSQNALLLPLLQALAASPGARDHCPRCRVSLTRADYEGAEIDRCPFCRGTLLRAGVLERLISRDSAAFSPDQIQQARVWRRTQKGAIAERDHFPAILCPLCATHMGKYVHSYLTQVIIDRCLNESCGAVWCDGGELETIQMLVQDAKAGRDSEGP
ncbi:MAG TPA: zf-TFIIB domain-containing protein, partial [bacterium]|nr:zf-TFIIB domain-containing protein [bacterium]